MDCACRVRALAARRRPDRTHNAGQDGPGRRRCGQGNLPVRWSQAMHNHRRFLPWIVVILVVKIKIITPKR
jgi:hypothetical protein